MSHDFFVFSCGALCASMGWFWIAVRLDDRWRQECAKIIAEADKHDNEWYRLACKHTDEAFECGCRITAENFMGTINDPVARRN